MTRRRLAAFALVLVLAPLLTGCWDSIDPKNRAFVTAIGLDAAPGGMLRLTLEIPTAAGLAPGGGGGGGTGATNVGGAPGGALSYTVSAVAPGFAEAAFRLQRKLDRIIFFGETMAIVIGRSLAERGPDSAIRDMVRYTRMDNATYVLMADGDASRLVALQTPGGRTAAKAIRSLFATMEGQARVSDLRLWEFYRAISNYGEDPEILVMRPDRESGIAMAGAAIFAGGRLARLLDLEQSLDLSMLLGTARSSATEIRFRGAPVTLSQLSAHARVRYTWPAGSSLPAFTNEVSVNAIVGNDPPDRRGWDNPSLRLLERAAASQIRERLRRTWALTQGSGSDVLLMGLRIYHMDPAGWSRLRWSRDYPRTPVNIVVHVHIMSEGQRT